MTEAELRQTYVNKMLSWNGLNVADGSHKKIIDIYNNDKPIPNNYKVKYTDAWCATTVSAAAIEVGITDIIPKECSCGRMIAAFQKIGRWEERDDYTPKIGDIIFFDWNDKGVGDAKGWPDHVGVVASINGNNIRTVEGNISKKVGGRDITVDYKFIRGYGLPDYATKAKSMSPAPTPAPVTPKPTIIPMKTVIASNSLNIRNKPTTILSEVTGVLKNGSKVTPLKKENGFVYFEGWCSVNYLK